MGEYPCFRFLLLPETTFTPVLQRQFFFSPSEWDPGAGRGELRCAAVCAPCRSRDRQSTRDPGSQLGPAAPGQRSPARPSPGPGAPCYFCTPHHCAREGPPSGMSNLTLKHVLLNCVDFMIYLVFYAIAIVFQLYHSGETQFVFLLMNMS